MNISAALLQQIGMGGLFLRELTTRRREPRGLAPSAMLREAGILEAMEGGGRVDGRTAAGYLYHSARITRTIAGCGSCADFGCGTGVQLLQVAAANPDVWFVGVDHSQLLLDAATRNAERAGVRNVEWVRDDVLRADSLGERRFGAVISTMTLHDLSSPVDLANFAAAIRRMLEPGGAVYVEDFARLRTTKSMDFFVSLNAPRELDPFSVLYRASLGAAFTLEELAEFSEALPGTDLHPTFIVPFLTVIKTPDRLPPSEALARLRNLRQRLNTLQRRDLADLQKFFALGGLRGDPFQP